MDEILTEQVPEKGPQKLVTRRGVLIGGSVVLIAAAGGSLTAAILKNQPAVLPDTTPPWLVTALAKERNLVSTYTSAVVELPQHRSVLNQILADHRAHEQALSGIAKNFSGTPQSPAENSPTTTTAPLSIASLVVLERQAATVTGAIAFAISGDEAPLLASIAACEASHSALLT